MALKPLYIKVLIKNKIFALQQGHQELFILLCHLKNISQHYLCECS